MALFGTQGFAELARAALPANLAPPSRAQFSFGADASALPAVQQQILRSQEFAPALFQDYLGYLDDPVAKKNLPRFFNDVWKDYQVQAALSPQLQFDQFLSSPSFDPRKYIRNVDPFQLGVNDAAFRRGYRVMRA